MDTELIQKLKDWRSKILSAGETGKADEMIEKGEK